MIGLIAGLVFAATQVTSPVKYEYLRIDTYKDEIQDRQLFAPCGNKPTMKCVFDYAGEQGWELVTSSVYITNAQSYYPEFITVFIFKRVKLEGKVK